MLSFNLAEMFFSCAPFKAQLDYSLLSEIFSDLYSPPWSLVLLVFTALSIHTSWPLYYQLQWIVSFCMAGQPLTQMTCFKMELGPWPLPLYTCCMNTFTFTHTYTHVFWLIHFNSIFFACGKAIRLCLCMYTITSVEKLERARTFQSFWGRSLHSPELHCRRAAWGERAASQFFMNLLPWLVLRE